MHPHERQSLLCASCVGIADKLLQSQGSWIAQSQQGTNLKQKQTWAAGKMGEGKSGDRKEIIRERREEEGCSNRKSSSGQDGALHSLSAMHDFTDVGERRQKFRDGRMQSREQEALLFSDE